MDALLKAWAELAKVLDGFLTGWDYAVALASALGMLTFDRIEMTNKGMKREARFATVGGLTLLALTLLVLLAVKITVSLSGGN